MQCNAAVLVQKKLKTAAGPERGTVKKADPTWLEGTSVGKKK